MNSLRSFLKFLLWSFVFLLLFVFLINSFDHYSGNDLVLERLVFGFVPFLKYNLPAISWNAATWGPGLGAFLIAVVVGHRYLSRWAKRTGRQWSFVTSFSLVMIVPVLFVISLIVPGVLLQWEVLRETVWIDVR